MVLEISGIRPELFPTEDSLVVNDPFKTYKFKLGADELQNTVIEKMYGPFTSAVDEHSPVGSPRPLSRNEDTAMASRQQAIDDLKRMIAERQARNESIGRVSVDSAKNMLKDKKDILQAQRDLLQTKANVIDDSLVSSIRPIKSAIPLRSKAFKELSKQQTDTPQEQTQQVDSQQESVTKTMPPKAQFIVIDEIEEDMSIASEEDINTSNIEKVEQTASLSHDVGADIEDGVIDVISDDEAGYNVIVSNDEGGGIIHNENGSRGPGELADDEFHSTTSDGGSSTESFHTAMEESSDEDYDVTFEVKKLNKALEAMHAQFERINKEKQENESKSKDIQLKLLGIRVRLSMNKNRNELKKKPISSDRMPLLGEIRKSQNDERVVQQHHAPRRRINYPQHDNYNFGYTPPSSFYHQLSHQPINPYISQPSPYVPMNILHQPPPPPPTELPPFTPPPPPPPPLAPAQATRNFMPSHATAPSINQYPAQQTKAGSSRRKNKKKGHNKNMGSSLPLESKLPLELQIVIENTLKRFEQFISLRVFNDKSYYPIIHDRPLSHPYRLVTIDDYTMPLHKVVINENKDKEEWKYPTTKFTLPAGVPIETEMDNSWFESPFFVMLRRKAASQRSNPEMQKSIDAIIQSIPPNNNLSAVKIGTPFFVNLDTTLEVARTYYHQQPKNEFFASLKLELSFYVNGNTSQFFDDYKECIVGLPLSVDVEWQRIRAEVTFACQLPLILNLLHRISLEHTFDSKESATISSMTAEVLIRLLRLNGLEQVLRLMVHNEIEVNTEKAEIFDMDDAPGLYLQEHDKYRIWMIILYYNINKSIPDHVCGAWMNGLVKEGTPSNNMSIFMIDWSASQLIEQPLDTATLFSSTNILLSMLRHFGNKACSDVKRKPLLVGVLRTLSNFLANIPSYKPPSTLILMREAQNIAEQIPEIREIITDLEIKTGTTSINIIEQVLNAKSVMSSSNLFSYSYNIARSYYERQPFSKHNLLIVSNILLCPLVEYKTQNTQKDLMAKLTDSTSPAISDEQIIIIVDTIKQRFFSSLGLDFSRQPYTDQSSKLRNVSFAWINLLLLTAISKFLYPETSVIRDSLDVTMKMIFNTAMTEISSEEGKMTLFKYAQNLKLAG